jgi:hypothetical protein
MFIAASRVNSAAGRLPAKAAAALFAAAMTVGACQGGASGLSAGLSDSQDVGVWRGPQTGLLAPFKESSFGYRTPLEVRDGGRFLRVPYDEMKDINERDAIPVRKAKSRFVRRLPRGAERELVYATDNGVLKYLAAGRLEGDSTMTVIYIHGRGGNRLWGFDDERFGGNFNRLKNMLLAAGGAYVSPDFTDFEEVGFLDIRRLVNELRPLTKGKLVVACGSLGNSHCWNLFHDRETARQVDGVVVLAGFPDPRLHGAPPLASASAAIPLVLAHGTADPDYAYGPVASFYETVRKARPGYPLRLILFETGKHGAPVRMIDWRDTLNWIAAQ